MLTPSEQRYVLSRLSDRESLIQTATTWAVVWKGSSKHDEDTRFWFGKCVAMITEKDVWFHETRWAKSRKELLKILDIP